MMNKSDLSKSLEAFGLNQKETATYLFMLQKGIITPLELSRLTHVNRTTLYRLLEKLKEIGLVEEITEDKSTSFKAVGPERLQMIMTRKEAELSKLKESLPRIVNQLKTTEDSCLPSTKVVYYRGKSGLQQLLWNTLQAKNEVVGYGYASWNEGVGKNFAEKLRQEYVDRGLQSKEILNKFANTFTENKLYLARTYQQRILPKSDVEINHDTYIYNDVFAFYHFFKDELFGVEIHNSEIAKTQRQIFYLLWKTAKKVI
ncbi:hypothetical protein COS31_04255 [Candidatus Roizmanbacteria bacterium CG02_land_8_20_14_3_00_36_15]|nr:MAG: hypothetical protein COS31_04255 [Candidatus Roizmanbacteria bacterium CG02_land_8_20_14_3_00_36_15]